MKKSDRLIVAITCAAVLGCFGVSLTAYADDTVATARQKISRNGGVYLLNGKPDFFAKDRTGKTKTLNDIWKVLNKNGVAVGRIDVVREGEAVVLFSYSPNSGLVSK